MRTLLTDQEGNPVSVESRRSSSTRLQRTLLSTLLQNRPPAWDDIVRRATAHPHEILVRDDHGLTPLHQACYLDPPPEVIRALQATAHYTNAFGLTPLHIATSQRCQTPALQSLMDLHPAALQTPSRMGRTPMHYACMSFRGLDLEAFQALLEATLKRIHTNTNQEQEAAASEESMMKLEDSWTFLDNDMQDHQQGANVMTWKDSTGRTPLELLFYRYRERVRSAICRLDRRGNASASATTPDDDDATLGADLGHLWGKAQIVVARQTNVMSEDNDSSFGVPWEMQTLFPPATTQQQQTAANSGDGSPERDRKFRILHASVGLIGYGCPPEMIRLALSMHPEQVREMDEDGNLPLHIAAIASSFDPNGASSPNNVRPDSDEDSTSVFSGSTAMASFFSSSTANATPYAFDKVIKILLRHFPQAARIPQRPSGLLPLAMALRGGKRTWEDGIKTLLNAYPAALHGGNIPPSLYPEVLSFLNHGQQPGDLQTPRHNRLLVTKLSSGVVGGSRNERNRVFCTRKKAHKKGRALLEATCRSRTSLFALLNTKPDLIDTKWRTNPNREMALHLSSH